jgi:hypothetical protein
MIQMKQPHQDVTGTDRTDLLLSLDEAALAHRAWLAGLAFHLSTATTVGNPAPVVSRMAERIRSPQIGDLVVEQSSHWRGNPDDRVKGFGILVEHRTEWWDTDEDYQRHITEYPEEADEPRATDHAWYVQYGSAAVDICRWTNCSFLAIPTPGERFRVPGGTPTGSDGIVVTRDSLLGALSDSGFKLRVPR